MKSGDLGVPHYNTIRGILLESDGGPELPRPNAIEEQAASDNPELPETWQNCCHHCCLRTEELEETFWITKSSFLRRHNGESNAPPLALQPDAGTIELSGISSGRSRESRREVRSPRVSYQPMEKTLLTKTWPSEEATWLQERPPWHLKASSCMRQSPWQEVLPCEETLILENLQLLHWGEGFTEHMTKLK